MIGLLFPLMCTAMSVPKAPEPIVITKSQLPPALANLTILPPGERLAFNTAEDLQVTPMDQGTIASFVGSEEDPLYFVSNGTHINSFATTTYHFTYSFFGLIVNKAQMTFMDYNTWHTLSYFDAFTFGAVGGASGGAGFCWFNYDPRWLANQNWEAVFSSFGGTIGGGGYGMGFSGMSQENIGNCAVAGGGTQLSISHAGKGRFHL
jgi:hypothetical protein